jgi:hypothetical protein
MAPCCQFCQASRQSWKMLVLAIAALGCAAPVAEQVPFISFEALAVTLRKGERIDPRRFR